MDAVNPETFAQRRIRVEVISLEFFSYKKSIELLGVIMLSAH